MRSPFAESCYTSQHLLTYFYGQGLVKAISGLHHTLLCWNNHVKMLLLALTYFLQMTANGEHFMLFF